jgi:hypothetical protein
MQGCSARAVVLGARASRVSVIRAKSDFCLAMSALATEIALRAAVRFTGSAPDVAGSTTACGGTGWVSVRHRLLS